MQKGKQIGGNRAVSYRIRMYYVGLDSAEKSLARIANRVRKGEHDIPAEDVRRRFAGRAHALALSCPTATKQLF